MPNLIEVQLNSYKWFFEHGLKELLAEINPIHDFTSKNLELYFGDYFFDKPKYDEITARERNTTYEAPLYVSAKLVNKVTGKTKTQDVYFGDFPLMTPRGTLVINGVERVVVSQLIKSPGVFFTTEYAKGKDLYGAKIVPNRGAWLELDTDTSGVIGVKIDRKRRIPVTALLRIFGLKTNEQILEAFKDADTNPEVKYLAVVMGRHAGFLTAAAALGRKFPGDGPHLIYLPERSFDLQQFLADVKACYARHGRCVVAVSEGIHDASGTPMLERLTGALEQDAHGNVQLSGTGALADLLCEQIRCQLGIKRVRGDTFGYLQRSFLGCVSDVDQREAREVGETAVQFALWGDRDGSVAIQRCADYAVNYTLLDLATVAGRTRVMDDAFIAASGTAVTDAFLRYLRPLLGSGMPEAFRLRGAPVARRAKSGSPP